MYFLIMGCSIYGLFRHVRSDWFILRDAFSHWLIAIDGNSGWVFEPSSASLVPLRGAYGRSVVVKIRWNLWLRIFAKLPFEKSPSEGRFTSQIVASPLGKRNSLRARPFECFYSFKVVNNSRVNFVHPARSKRKFSHFSTSPDWFLGSSHRKLSSFRQ